MMTFSRRDICISMFSVLWLGVSPGAQAANELTDSVKYRIQMLGSTSWGDGTTPLWLNANQYGLSSLEQTNGYLRASLQKDFSNDFSKRWDISWALDVAVAHHFTSSFIVQQAFLKLRHKKVSFTLGSKEEPMELKPQELSTGSQTLGINARPVPQVRIALDDYVRVFGAKWLGVKGHFSVGMLTDAGFQKTFTQKENRYTENVLYHSKAGFLRLGNPEHPLTLEMGLEMATLFGGTRNQYGEELKNPVTFGKFIEAITFGGKDSNNGVYTSGYGDKLGSLMARINLDFNDWYLGAYVDHFFEDHSGLFFRDFDGWGEGDEWNTKKYNKWHHYKVRDGVLGVNLKLKKGTWLQQVAVEYIDSKYQSGEIYYDHAPGRSSEVKGRDDYYNHSFYAGWQHWGQAIGNPLFTSPIYNKNNDLHFYNNRFVAWHLGIMGQPTERFSYRILATRESGYGTYASWETYDPPRRTISLMLEGAYSLKQKVKTGGWLAKVRYGSDAGALLGHNKGIQFSLSYDGLIK